MKYVFLLEENSQGIMNLYENAKKLIGPVPPQYECIYFIAMIIFAFMVFAILLSPLILFGGKKR